MYRVTCFLSFAFVLTGLAAAQTPSVSRLSSPGANVRKLTIAPGEVFFVVGTNLFAQSRGAICGDRTEPWPRQNSPCFSRVTIGSKFAALGEGQQFSRLLVQAPWDLDPGNEDLVVFIDGLDPPAQLGAEKARLASKSFVSPDGNGQTDPLALTVVAYAPVVSGEFTRSDGAVVSVERPAAPGETLTAHAYGLGLTETVPLIGEPAVDFAPVLADVRVVLTPPSSPAIPALVKQQGADFEAVVSSAGIVAGSVGTYQVEFVVPASLPGGDYVVQLELSDGASEPVRSNSVVLAVEASNLTPTLNAVTNAATFADGALAPGSIASVFAGGINAPQVLAAFPSSDVGGLSVSFSGTAAALFAVVPASGQVNLLVPRSLPVSGTSDVVLRTASGATEPLTINLAEFSPGLFPVNDPTTPGRRFAAAILGNTVWLPIPDSVSTALGLPINCAADGVSAASFCGQPVRPGEVIQLFSTGLGRATPGGEPAGALLPDDQVAPADGSVIYSTVALPEVLVGGIPARVVFSGLAPGFSGLYQVNIEIPAGVAAGDAVAIVVRMPDGSADEAFLAIGE